MSVRFQPVRLLPSFTDLAFLMPVAFLFGRMGGTRDMLGDGDTGWHIRTGEWILANGRVPRTDLFSFTKPGEPWFAWEWLWDAAFAWLHQRGGMAAVILASVLLIALTFAIVFRIGRQMSGNAPVAAAVTFLATAASSVHWLARPHLVTFLFSALFLMLLERARRGQQRLLWILPALAALWTSLHGGFFVGVVLVAAYAAGEIADTVIHATGGAWERSRPYIATSAGCLAASLANPYGWQLHIHVLHYLSGSYEFQHIGEFLSINFQHPIARYFECLIVLGSGAAFWSAYRRRYAHALLIGGWMHLALISGRNIPIFAIVSAPAIALCAAEWLRQLKGAPVAGWIRGAAGRLVRTTRDLGEMDAIPRLHLVSVGAFALLIAVVYAPAPPKAFRAEYDPRTYPAKALSVVADANRIFTRDTWGGYLIYKLYPKRRVFVDGRSDFYGPRFEQEYLDVMDVKHGWEDRLNGYGIDTILLPPDAALAGALKESRRWHPVYDDGVAIVFRAVRGTGSEQVSAIPGGKCGASVGNPRT